MHNTNPPQNNEAEPRSWVAWPKERLFIKPSIPFPDDNKLRQYEIGIGMDDNAPVGKNYVYFLDDLRAIITTEPLKELELAKPPGHQVVMEALYYVTGYNGKEWLLLEAAPTVKNEMGVIKYNRFDFVYNRKASRKDGHALKQWIEGMRIDLDARDGTTGTWPAKEPRIRIHEMVALKNKILLKPTGQKLRLLFHGNPVSEVEYDYNQAMSAIKYESNNQGFVSKFVHCGGGENYF